MLDFGLAKACRERLLPRFVGIPNPHPGCYGSGCPSRHGSVHEPRAGAGQAVDKRADIWAFGCCLYEALTGKAAFLGETVSDTIVKIVDASRIGMPYPKRHRRPSAVFCVDAFRKTHGRRLHDMADARIEIEEAIAEPSLPEKNQFAFRTLKNGESRCHGSSGYSSGDSPSGRLCADLSPSQRLRFALL